MPSNGIRCTRVDKLPDGDHYIIMIDTTIHIPGDERSRTNPGHGYPATQEHFMSYNAYTSKELWEKDIVTLTNDSYPNAPKFVAFKATRANITTHTKVEIS